MQLVVADTGPIHYLLLIDHVDILPTLFKRVVLPSAVRDELTNPKTPPIVCSWTMDPPSWVHVRSALLNLPRRLSKDLGPGESSTLALAAELHADLVLMGDRRGVAAAHQMGIAVTGTLGLLARAAKLGLIDLSAAFDRLKLTNFRYRQDIMDRFLADMRHP